MDRVIGRCSLCGDDVVVYSGPWGGMNPPVPRCRGCGAHQKNVGPVIPMEPPTKFLGINVIENPDQLPGTFTLGNK